MGERKKQNEAEISTRAFPLESPSNNIHLHKFNSKYNGFHDSDTRVRSSLLKKYTYLMILGPFRSLSISKSAYVNTCFFSTDNQSPREPK